MCDLYVIFVIIFNNFSCTSYIVFNLRILKSEYFIFYTFIRNEQKVIVI